MQYKHEVGSLQQKLSGLTREELQRALGVKPMDKSSRWAPYLPADHTGRIMISIALLLLLTVKWSALEHSGWS